MSSNFRDIFHPPCKGAGCNCWQRWIGVEMVEVTLFPENEVGLPITLISPRLGGIQRKMAVLPGLYFPGRDFAGSGLVGGRGSRSRYILRTCLDGRSGKPPRPALRDRGESCVPGVRLAARRSRCGRTGTVARNLLRGLLARHGSLHTR